MSRIRSSQRLGQIPPVPPVSLVNKAKINCAVTEAGSVLRTVAVHAFCTTRPAVTARTGASQNAREEPASGRAAEGRFAPPLFFL